MRKLTWRGSGKIQRGRFFENQFANSRVSHTDLRCQASPLQLIITIAVAVLGIRRRVITTGWHARSERRYRSIVALESINLAERKPVPQSAGESSMCPLTGMQQPQPAISSCFASPLKRTRESGKDARPRKRVTFSPEECVLGMAQDYDRTNLREPSFQRVIMAPRQPNNASFLAHGPRSQDRSPPNEQEATGVAAKGHPNFCGMWRRTQSFNWSALLELSGVPKDAIPEEVRKQFFLVPKAAAIEL